VAAIDDVGVTKVELRVNGALVASDTTSPYGFSWDSNTVANGIATLTAVAFDAAGHSTTSVPVSVNVANAPNVPAPPLSDIAAPLLQILTPGSGSIKGRGSVSINTTASDNSGAAG